MTAAAMRDYWTVFQIQVLRWFGYGVKCSTSVELYPGASKAQMHGAIAAAEMSGTS